MQEKKVSLLNEFNERLVGIETVPSTRKEKYPTVILVHGFGVTKEEYGMFDGLAKVLSDAILVYRFDFSGCGESGGDYSETSLSKLRSDLSKIFEFVKAQRNVDGTRIGMVGQSLGTATIIALEPNIKCIVLMSSVSHPKESLAKFFGGGYNPEGISSVKRSDGSITRIKPHFWRDLDKYDLLKLIKKLHCPILFVHGSRDDRVPISNTEDYFKNANQPKENASIDGAGHDFRPHREKVYKIVTDWLLKYLI